MAEQITLSVAKRETTGKNESRRLRREGLIPATVYGEGKDPVSVSVNAFWLDRLLHSESGENTIFELALEGTDIRRPAMVKDFQLDPVTDQLVHADFIRVQADHALQVNVHVEIEGVSIGVKVDGGRMENPTREVLVECLPKNIPSKLILDVSELHVGQTLRAGDLPLPDGVALLTDAELPLVTIHAKAAEEEVVEDDAAAAPDAGEPAPEPPAE
jgi:large subunit ribosomal protein L25